MAASLQAGIRAAFLRQNTILTLLQAHPGTVQVREGPVLAENLRRLLLGRQLQRFEPQATYLSIVTTGDQHAVAVKGPFCLEVGAGCSIPHVKSMG